jgi:hypothetical protein
MSPRTLLIISLIPSLSLALGFRPKVKALPGFSGVEFRANQPGAPADFDITHS